MSLQLIEAAKLLRFDPATGWPDQFTMNQAIALQTWQEGIAVMAWGSKADDLRRLFHLDHGKGNVKVTTTSRIETREWSKDIEVTFASVYWDGVPGKRRTVRGVKDVEIKTDHITAQAFAAWLAANEIEPSRHVAAWFKAMGANTDPTKTPIEAHEQWDAPLPKLPLHCELFALTEVGAAHWLAMDAWTIEEAALLLSGANPKRISEFAKDTFVAKPDFESCGYVGIFDRITRASEVGALTFPSAPSTVCEWASKKHGIPASLRVALAAHRMDGSQSNQARGVTYSYPLSQRLQALTPWRGGRITDTDVLTLDEAARMASRHAGEDVSVAEFLRAAGRGEIVLRAIVHRSAKVQRYNGGIYCNKGAENENVVPSGSIPTLPLTACQHLAAGGRASWRTFDGFEEVNGMMMRFTEAMLTDDEPDFETVPADCRVTGNDVHALADAFCEVPAQPEVATPVPVADSPSNALVWTVATPKRYHGYTAPLHRLLSAAYQDGRPRPTARDVLEVWRNRTPPEIAKVLPDGFDYYNAKGDTKAADLEALRKAIERMTVAREAPV